MNRFAETGQRLLVVFLNEVGLAEIVVGIGIKRIEAQRTLQTGDGLAALPHLHPGRAGEVVNGSIFGRQLGRLLKQANRLIRPAARLPDASEQAPALNIGRFLQQQPPQRFLGASRSPA